ncbi:hypothetical protein CPB83DRAFT_901829 [Crepidotus variabilis]|uniref:RNA polymerase II assembly factor Rtp1 C-terminal domain-containing protein n=1 Tax=Crepidotus variabilis TaxID=179855 RepID=A0A9P6EU58_9AGAR|nr:hypothetical protein CPB83DRAFT_901829 [Crepidotus variabilis]
MPPSPTELASALSDANALLETFSEATSTTSIEDILKIRLSTYYKRINESEALEALENLRTNEDLELQTAQEALVAIQRIQSIVDVAVNENVNEPPPLGTRDLAKLRTLLSLVFKWGVTPLYTKVSQLLPGSFNENSPKIVNLSSGSTIQTNYNLLSYFTRSVLGLVFPQGVQGRISQTLITTTILSKHVSDILVPAVTLGWMPEKLASEEMPVMHDFRPLAVRLQKLLSPAVTIAALGGILVSSTPAPPLHVRKTCKTLLTKQLLRPDGIQGLCIAMFSEEESNGDEVNLEKLEQIAKIVISVPAGMRAEDYFQSIFPRLFQILAKSTQTNHQRAAAFSIYRAIIPEKSTQSSIEAGRVALRLLQEPFCDSEYVSPLLGTQQPPKQCLSPREALDSIIALLANTEPSPNLISTLLSSLVPSLYGLYFDISQHKTVDPQLKELVIGLLKSWGKIIESVEGETILWKLVESNKEWDWKFDLEGNLSKTPSQEKKSNNIILPQATGDQEEEPSFDLNLFDLYPDPVHFVETLKQFDRGDLSSSLFVTLLENYRDMKTRPTEDSMSILHQLQIIMQMQKRLSEGTTSNILRKPDKLLSFIFHVLSSATMTTSGNETRRDDSSNNNNMLDEADSDDEDAGPQIIGPDGDLIETTITLLLSILEADETLSVATHPILNDIFSLLEPISTKSSETLRPLAREARLVMTARLAETSGAHKPKNKAEDEAQEIYQRALKLLQDPILPVRAHGLLLLRELLGPTYSGNSVNQALVPSILSIFLQSVQDEDSYIFLNAVQGLALLVDRFGKEILQGLIRDYAGKLEGLGASVLTKQNIDMRTRIGEALGSVIRKCGNTLGIYINIIVPPLLTMVRNRDIPTVLKTSCLSLLGDCVGTYSLAMLPYVEDLTLGLLDLLQLESIAATEVPRSIANDKVAENLSSTIGPDPTSQNPKLPELRRAALHFLSLLIKSSTELVYNEVNLNSSAVFPQSAVRKASITLGYISSTDEDGLVRVMAREAKDNLEQLQGALVGM